MLYTVGERIDLTSLNTKKAVAVQPKKSALQANLESTQTLYYAGTSITFDKETLSIRRHIRVEFP